MNMTPNKIAFGERYGDDSGWQRYIELDQRVARVSLDMGGNTLTSFDLDDAWWLLRALIEARHHFGMDNIVRDGPTRVE